MARNDVWQGAPALMVLRTLGALGLQHGYGMARPCRLRIRAKGFD
jgi:hypothetical protein